MVVSLFGIEDRSTFADKAVAVLRAERVDASSVSHKPERGVWAEASGSLRDISSVFARNRRPERARRKDVKSNTISIRPFDFESGLLSNTPRRAKYPGASASLLAQSSNLQRASRGDGFYLAVNLEK
jgi:hypothetical protein